MRWLAFDIGCIECGETSAVVGVYPTQVAAQDAVNRASDEQAANWQGQHNFVIYDLAEFMGGAE